MRLRRRIARIMKAHQMGMVGYRMPDGSVKYIRSKDHLDALHEGADTPRGRVLLQATECVTQGGGRLYELAQSLVGDGPAVIHQPETSTNPERKVQ